MEVADLSLLTYVIRCSVSQYDGYKEFYYTGNDRPPGYEMLIEISKLLTENLTEAKIYNSAVEAMKVAKNLSQFYNVRALPVSKKPFFIAILKGERK